MGSNPNMFMHFNFIFMIAATAAGERLVLRTRSPDRPIGAKGTYAKCTHPHRSSGAMGGKSRSSHRGLSALSGLQDCPKARPTPPYVSSA